MPLYKQGDVEKLYKTGLKPEHEASLNAHDLTTVNGWLSCQEFHLKALEDKVRHSKHTNNVSTSFDTCIFVVFFLDS